MSRPQNSLNLFRSYAYHHILVACDGTDTAEELAKSSEITLFDHERAHKKFCPQRNKVGRYVVLINGTSDTQFSIRSAKWASVLIPNEANTGEGNTHFRTMAVDGELEIIEPLGVNFLNVINEVTKSLGTDPNGVVFLLKTIFVGERDDGQTETISNIRPLLFIAYDISALFDITGAEYVLSFVGVTNGAARLPHVSSVADEFVFDLNGGARLGGDKKGADTLARAMSGLASQLNTYYEKQRDILARQAECFGMDSEFFKSQYIDVKYDIILDPVYQGEEYVIGTDEAAAKLNTGDDDPIIKKGNSISVEGLIDTIMLSCQQVISEEDDENDDRFMHKITSTIRTGPDKYEVTYHIQRFRAAVIPVEKFLTFEPPKINGVSQGIEFDYIFTGRNIDIKSFDIKMQMGMAFLQTIAATPSIPTNAGSILRYFNPEVKVSGTGNSQGSGDQKATTQGRCEEDARNEDQIRKKPLFLGMSIKDSILRNKRFPGPATSYAALLARHAAYENLEARMVIHGNPQLLEETTQLPGDLDPTITGIQPAVISVDGFERLPEEEQIRHIWTAVHRTPAYVKVNVKMPNSSIAFPKGEDQFDDGDFAEDFWYTGWFFVYGINNVFDDGEFTQEIEMFSLPTDASQEKLGRHEKKCAEEIALGEENDTEISGEEPLEPAPSENATGESVQEQAARRSAAANTTGGDFVLF